MIVSSAFDLSDVTPSPKDYYLINPDNGIVYDNNTIIRDSDINNAKTVYLI